MDTKNKKIVEENASDKNFVDVAVITTSGSYPDEGFNKVPIHQKIRVFLDEAALELKIADVSNWVVRINNSEVDQQKNYEDNNLSGEIEIDFGPREGGGGNA